MAAFTLVTITLIQPDFKHQAHMNMVPKPTEAGGSREKPTDVSYA